MPNITLNPPEGLRNASIYPAEPESEAAAREQFQRVIDQILQQAAAKLQEDWITPTLLNGWVQYGGTCANLRYYKDNFGKVVVSGVVKNGTTSSGTVILNLPVGYRPASDHSHRVSNASGGGGRVEFSANGNITVQEGITSEFLGIEFSFKAEQ